MNKWICCNHLKNNLKGVIIIKCLSRIVTLIVILAIPTDNLTASRPEGHGCEPQHRHIERSQALNKKVATIVREENRKFRTHVKGKSLTPRREPVGFLLPIDRSLPN